MKLEENSYSFILCSSLHIYFVNNFLQDNILKNIFGANLYSICEETKKIYMYACIFNMLNFIYLFIYLFNV